MQTDPESAYLLPQLLVLLHNLIEFVHLSIHDLSFLILEPLPVECLDALFVLHQLPLLLEPVHPVEVCLPQS